MTAYELELRRRQKQLERIYAQRDKLFKKAVKLLTIIVKLKGGGTS